MHDILQMDLLTSLLGVLSEIFPLVLASVGQLMSTVAYKVFSTLKHWGLLVLVLLSRHTTKLCILIDVSADCYQWRAHRICGRKISSLGECIKNDSLIRSQQHALIGKQSDRILCFSGVLCSGRLMIGLYDDKSLLQTKWFYDWSVSLQELEKQS